MPFADSFEDVFYYGIARPVRAAGLLCERIDQVAFTGDIIIRMRERIASSAVVVADLSEANPNVYLEVGYAWGVNVPCILICNRKTESLHKPQSDSPSTEHEAISEFERSAPNIVDA